MKRFVPGVSNPNYYYNNHPVTVIDTYFRCGTLYVTVYSSKYGRNEFIDLQMTQLT